MNATHRDVQVPRAQDAQERPPPATTELPLCVDLDGTLLRTDLLWEALFTALKKRPLALLRAAFALPRGKAAFKLALAADVAPEFETLPLNQALLGRLTAARAAGRRLVLATASPRAWAQCVADRTGLFDEVIATDGARNLSGANKARALVERFGERGFDYAGNSRDDVEVWRAARSAWVVGASALTTARARRVATVAEVLDQERPQLASLARAIRPHQWLKNLLLFVPLLTAQAWWDLRGLLGAVIGFAAFSLAASAAYLLNDLLDLDADRRHPRKRARPLASGALPLPWGFAAMLLLLAMGFTLARIPGPGLVAALSIYVIVTVSYSMLLKRKPVVDALVLAGLYTLRLVAGGAATGYVPSSWLLAFAMFIFLSLAFAKRYAELLVMHAAELDSAAGRGYQVDDLPLVQNLGVTSGYVSVLVLALYFDSPAARALYVQPHLLWVLCPIMAWWIGRVWLLTHRGEMHDDPVVFALRDRSSYAAALIGALALLFAR
jgi:4-hydroxybenzoate polyprenyltransferase/phosphoserine phosphatase